MKVADVRFWSSFKCEWVNPLRLESLPPHIAIKIYEAFESCLRNTKDFKEELLAGFGLLLHH